MTSPRANAARPAAASQARSTHRQRSDALRARSELNAGSGPRLRAGIRSPPRVRRRALLGSLRGDPRNAREARRAATSTAIDRPSLGSSRARTTRRRGRSRARRIAVSPSRRAVGRPVAASSASLSGRSYRHVSSPNARPRTDARCTTIRSSSKRPSTRASNNAEIEGGTASGPRETPDAVVSSAATSRGSRSIRASCSMKRGFPSAASSIRIPSSAILLLRLPTAR